MVKQYRGLNSDRVWKYSIVELYKPIDMDHQGMLDTMTSSSTPVVDPEPAQTGTTREYTIEHLHNCNIGI